MITRDFDIKQLNVFITTVRCGGLSAAQDHLNMSLPTISGHINSLEDKLGVNLCTRGRSGFELTMHGRDLYEKAVELVDNFKEFSDFAHGLQDGLKGSLRIGITPQSLRDFPISETFERYYGRENTVVLDFRSQSDHTLHRMVADRELDVAIGVADPASTSPLLNGLEFHPLFEEIHLVYCGDKHPLFLKNKITKADLIDQRHYLRGCNPIDSELFGSINVGANIEDASTALALLLSGQFIGFYPAQIARPWVDRKLLRPILITELKDAFQVGYVVKANMPPSTNLESFLHDLADCFAAYRADIEGGRFGEAAQFRHTPVFN